jgi:hypothetical protein
MALDPEKEFQRGLQALRRGRDDIAALRFVRAEREGIDVRGRILGGARPEKQKIVSGKGLQELTVDQFKDVQSMRPVQSGLGKEWNPDQSAAMRRNLQRGSGQHHIQNSPRNIIELPRNTPSTIPGSGGGSAATIAGPKHPFQILIANTYDTSVPPIFVSATATLHPGIAFQGLSNFSSAYTITNLGSTFVPVAGQYLYIAGVTSTGSGFVTVTSLTLTQAAALPARTAFSSGLQTSFAFPIGSFLVNPDGSFAPEQWCHGHLTVLDICVSGQAAKYPFVI